MADQRIDETIRGGAYRDADGKGWHNANGDPIDPPAWETPPASEAEADKSAGKSAGKSAK